MIYSVEFDYRFILILLLPLLGTTLGSFMVFIMKKEVNEKVIKTLLGFASGVMIAASIWSLLIPAIDSYKNGISKWAIPSIGFSIGIIFLLLLDILIPHEHLNKEEEGIENKKISEKLKMFLAVTIHNIPEGLSVGVVLSGAFNSGISISEALVLSIGIAIQNFPEGAIISMPLKGMGYSKIKSFLFGFLSGVVEPIASLLALFLTSITSKILPITLSFAGGAMVYVVIEELIPEANTGKHSNLPTIGFAIGFVLMMILDVALS